MNRRSLISTFCTGALALLAPVMAWARRERETSAEDVKCLSWRSEPLNPAAFRLRAFRDVGKVNRNGVTDWRDVDWSDENATLVVRASYLKTLHEAALDHHQTILQLRDRLAERNMHAGPCQRCGAGGVMTYYGHAGEVGQIVCLDCREALCTS